MVSAPTVERLRLTGPPVVVQSPRHIPIVRLANPRASIWIPAYGGMRAGTVCCIVAELSLWGNSIRFGAQDEDDHIGRTRCRATTGFLKAPDKTGDVLLMVDHDIQWQPGDLAHIARDAVRENAIVGGIYPKRAFGQGIPYRWKGTGDYKIGDDKLVEAEWVSSGFMAIPRKLLQSLVDTKKVEWICEGNDTKGGYWSFFIPYIHATVHGKEYLSEDWALCQTALDAGFKVMLSMKPRLDHEGWHKFWLVDAQVKLPETQDLVLHVVDEMPPVGTDLSSRPGEKKIQD